jgi:hypothetical protein
LTQASPTAIPVRFRAMPVERSEHASGGLMLADAG